MGDILNCYFCCFSETKESEPSALPVKRCVYDVKQNWFPFVLVLQRIFIACKFHFSVSVKAVEMTHNIEVAFFLSVFNLYNKHVDLLQLFSLCDTGVWSSTST